MADPDLSFVLGRLDRIQTELGMMRLRDEQREASYQALTTTLSRQMVEMTMALEERLNGLDAKLDVLLAARAP